MASKEYRFPFCVPYAHVDQMRVVYYANYFVYFEMARTALLQEAGLSYREMEAGGVMLPVVAAHCDYRQPARYEDWIEVRSTCLPFEGSRLRIAYEVWRAGDLLATGYTHHVCMSPAGKVLRPTAALRALTEATA
jgi:acyl-CoA thioester hydrolase